MCIKYTLGLIGNVDNSEFEINAFLMIYERESLSARSYGFNRKRVFIIALKVTRYMD